MTPIQILAVVIWGGLLFVFGGAFLAARIFGDKWYEWVDRIISALIIVAAAVAVGGLIYLTYMAIAGKTF